MAKSTKYLSPIFWAVFLLSPTSLLGQTNNEQRPVPGASFGSANIEPQTLPAGPPPAFSDPSLNEPNPPGQGLGTSFGSNTDLERSSTNMERPLENSALDPEGPPP